MNNKEDTIMPMPSMDFSDLRPPEGKLTDPATPNLHWPDRANIDIPAPIDSYEAAKPAKPIEGDITCWGGTIHAAVVLGLHVDLGICRENDGFPQPRIAIGCELFSLGASASVYTEKVVGSFYEHWTSSTKNPIIFYDMAFKISDEINKETILYEHIENKNKGRDIPYAFFSINNYYTVETFRSEHFIGLQSPSIGDITVDLGAILSGGAIQAYHSIYDKIASWFE
jgi:hypothetical protein